MPDVQVKGADTLARTLGSASRELGHLDQATQGASRMVASAGAMQAPRRTGALAASVTPMPEGNDAAAGSQLRYAAYVHWGTRRMAPRPFLVNAARMTQPAWMRLYEANTDAALGKVKGS